MIDLESFVIEAPAVLSARPSLRCVVFESHDAFPLPAHELEAPFFGHGHGHVKKPGLFRDTL